MLFLTGAQHSLSKSNDNPQSDPNNSLGGYVSSTPVPNGAINVLFDLVSSYTIEKRQKETIAIALINKFETAVTGVELKLVSDDTNLSFYKISAVGLGEEKVMESIGNRYQEPMMSEFHNASFYRAAVEMKVISPAKSGESIAIYPFNVVVTVEEEGVEGTWKSFEKAFDEDDTYMIKRLSEMTYKIERRDELYLQTPLNCSYIAEETFSATFSGQFKNKEDNSVVIAERLEPGEGVGIWVQRSIKSSSYRTNEQLIQDWKDKKVLEDVEEVELIISYNLVEE